MERTILLIDEPTRTRELLASILRMRGFAVFEVDDGRDALARVRRLRPDLIVLESMLPFMSGFEVRAALRRHAVLRKIPVLLMVPQIRHPLPMPAEEVLARPFGLHDLLGRVEALLAGVPEPLGSTR